MKNPFLSNLSLFDRLYPTSIHLPDFLRMQIANKIFRYLQRRLKDRKLPDRLTIFVTERCNLRCPHCFVSINGVKKYQEMNVKDYKKFFQKARGIFSQIIFTGGEATLRKDFGDIVISAFKDGAVGSTTIFTNGILKDRLLKAVNKAFEETDIRLNFQVSVDGNEAFHDANRGLKGALNKTLETMATLTDLKNKYPRRVGRLVAGTTISRHNLDELPEIIDLVRASEFSHVFNFVRSSKLHVFNVKNSLKFLDFSPNDFDGYLSTEQMKKALEIIKVHLWKQQPPNLIHATNRIILKTIYETLKEKNPKALCYSGLVDLVMLPDGGVARCEMLRSFANLKEFGWNIVDLMKSRAFKDHYVKTRGCWCTHDCAVGHSIIYDRELLAELFAKEQ